MDWFQQLAEAFLRDSPFDGVLLLCVAGVLVLVGLLLRARDRALLRTPIALLFAHVGVVVLDALIDHDFTSTGLRVTALFCVLAALARAGFLLVVDVFMLRVLGREISRIAHDLWQASVFIVVGLICLRELGIDPASILTTSALLTAAIGLSLQETLGNLVAGLAIQAQRPFEVGDWIQFSDKQEQIGKVVEVNWRATKVLTLDRAEIIVPNGVLAKIAIVNYTKPTEVVRLNIMLVVPFTFPPREVQRLVTAAAVGVPGVLTDPAPSTVTREYEDRGIRYWLRIFTDDYAKRDIIAGEVRDRIWYTLKRAGIPFAFNALDVHMHGSTDERERREDEEKRLAREAALHRVDFLDALPDEAIPTLARDAETRLYTAGEVILRQGDEGTELFVIERGEVAVLIKTEQGEREVSRIPRGKFFGEISLLTGAKRGATVKATRECELVVIDKSAIQPMLEAHPEFAKTMSDAVAARQAEIARTMDEADDEPEARKSLPGDELLFRIRRFFSLGDK